MGSKWAMKVSGRADFVVFEMEGELGLRSYNSIPVPDKLYFFLGGVTPGVNIDGMGIFWIRGAGGGVDKIYDTIFTASVLPPLTLMLTGEVALFGTLSARGDLALSARGFSAGISNLKAAEITLVDYMGTDVYWYPRIKFGASIQVSILDIIYGNLVFDPCMNFKSTGFYGYFDSMVINNNTDFASLFACRKESEEAYIQSLNEAFANFGK